MTVGSQFPSSRAENQHVEEDLGDEVHALLLDAAAEDDARICCGVEMSSREGHFQVYKLQPLFPFTATTQRQHRRKQLTYILCEFLSRGKVSFFQWEKKMKVQLATTILATMLFFAALWESVDAGGCEESKVGEENEGSAANDNLGNDALPCRFVGEC
ncbi:unnamed protein product [Darwinula stevensoni]|uniref:Uncharacterized protein n=1 Tax=Darwinula stevensoni TaxID=69355 RepID=A0A7R9AFT2_9CRUS|nr:unnamed protein product [Darwinula stevensoni]CAG0903548.1 unnamed protein product [Darwinula stevensoni]